MRNLILLAICLISPFLYSQETIILNIIDGNDDAYSLYEGFEENMFVDTDSLAMGYPGNPNRLYTIGLRYQSVPIPPGSTIESAFIQFSPYKAYDSTTVVRISCEENVNPLAFTNEDNNINDRPRKSQESDWWVQGWDWIANDNSKTHDIKDLVQYIIDMDGWEKYNPMVFFIGGVDVLTELTPKLAASYEYGAEWYAPALTITFTAPSAVDEQTLAKTMQIFPNPTTDKFVLSFVDVKQDEYEISIFDVQGRKCDEVFNGLLQHGDHQIQLSAQELNMEKGIYLVSVKSSTGQHSRKIVVR